MFSGSNRRRGEYGHPLPSFPVHHFVAVRDVYKRQVVEVPGEQETIELKEIGLTLILPDSWKGKYALEYDADFKEYYVYNPAIRKAMGGDSETLSSGGMLFYVKVWEEQLTKEQVEAGGEWSFAKCEYITTCLLYTSRCV